MDAGLDASTAIVIGSKHGQSPRDRTLLFKPAEHTLLDALTAAGIEVAYSTGDTVEIIYLLDSTRAQQAAQILTDLNNTACVTTTTTCWYGRMRGVYWGDSLATIGLAPPAQDPRMPDVVVDTQPGVIVDGSKAKLSEHGGFSAFDDRSVGLLVASPALTSTAAGSRCAAPVLSKSVAPTILALLGISPNSLAGVRHEGTPVLPCLA
ncbi:hypothetical protein CHLRE_03g166350v5 [Chlamydomonas reinhardtii]|uniref:Uncharacterized protein n=1 Tax=Chlamydomonas reinhardtii TaxID=3055 RepID=A0A2K3DWS3_CHLRE|nr:uncharacterized protein CHLRE_03g166350v5 [Chlamydomonas reinhardtii]PNW84973.1 hypothetical protein CHLRE_03g166350v5 [Chlamydomonas reinhardtii]